MITARTSVRIGILFGLFVLAATHPRTQVANPRPARNHVLAWADVRNGYQHEVISHALSVLERLGYESGAYDMVIRTDSQLITRQPITFKTGTGIATGEQFLAHNLDYFGAIFFFGVREIDLTSDQRRDLLAFVRDDGKGFVAAHSAAIAFFSWPEFGDMIGGRFDEHPWGITDATVVVDEPRFPAMRGFPPRTTIVPFSMSPLAMVMIDAFRIAMSCPASAAGTSSAAPMARAK